MTSRNQPQRSASRQALRREIRPRKSWINERLDLSALYRKYGRKVFPVHSTFFLGEMALFSFIILILTGIYLGFIYVPSNVEVTVNGETLPEAYASVRLIESIPVANLFRSTHHWAAHVMIASILLHLLRIFFTGSYRKPREINWAIGVVLLGLTLMAGFVGYALPYDSYAVTATGIGYSIARSIPWIGGFASELFFGGAFPSLGSLARLYTIHVFILPAILTAVMAVHLLIIVKQKHAQPGYARKEAEPGKVLGVPLIPYQALLAGQLLLLMFGVLFLLSAFVPPHPLEEFGPPQAATAAVKPDWYLLWLYGALKIIPADFSFELFGATIGPDFMGGLLFPALVFGILTFAPWMDRTNRRAVRRFEYLEPVSQSPVRTAAGVTMLSLLGTLFLAAYYDEIGMSLPGIWAVVVIVPIAAGLLTWFIIQSRQGENSFDPRESFESLFVDTHDTFNAADLEMKNRAVKMKRAPVAMAKLPADQRSRLVNIAAQDSRPEDTIVSILNDAGEWVDLARLYDNDEDLLEVLDYLEGARPALAE